MAKKESTADNGQEVAVESLTIDFTAYYAVQAPQTPREKAPALLLALHGWGQRCDTFLQRFRRLREQNMVVLAPQGPHQFYLDPPAKRVGFSWLTAYERARSIDDINAYLKRLLDVLAGRIAYDRDRIYVLGFSQGVSMAYRFALFSGVPVAGLIACCADLAPDAAGALETSRRFPVLLAHATEDAYFDREKADDALARLEEAGHPCELYLFAGGHRIPASLVEKIADWLPTG